MASAAHPSGSASAASREREIAVRLIAQEGLAIALASTVLQTQLYVLFNVLEFEKGCKQLDGGGSYKTVSKSKPTPENGAVSLNFYFDRKCRSLFAEAAMNEELQGTKKNGEYVITGDVTYYDRASDRVGAMRIDERAVIEKGLLQSVSGLGLFKPTNGGPEVRLGLACDLPDDLSNPFVCSGGVAQAFSGIGLSLGSVSPLTLRLLDNGGVSFKGVRSTFVTAPSGTLKIKRLGKQALTLSTPNDKVGSTSAVGSAASFGLFPPKPTGWTVTNAANGFTFALEVVDETKRNSVATVVDKAGKQIALVKVDQSGTGWISYFGGPRVPVVSWVLGG